MRYDEAWQNRSELRAVVWEIASGRCEHPIRAERLPNQPLIPCAAPAKELAHIQPRGMGHTGYRDSLANVIAACTYHARSTDDLSHEAWVEIGLSRRELAEWIRHSRRGHGWSTA